MSVAKRFWEGHLYQDATEIGFANGTISIDRGLEVFQQIGHYDQTARRETYREITGTIDHGYISATLFASGAYQTSNNPWTFQIQASFSDHAIVLSGCSIETFDLDLPADGWITESISFRAKTVKSY
jgi:hypothetical protein